MKIQVKLMIGFLSVIAIFSIGLGIMYTQIAGVKKNMNDMIVRSDNSQNLSEIRSLNRFKLTQMLDYLLNPEQLDFVDQYRENAQKQIALLKVIEPYMVNPEDKKDFSLALDISQSTDDLFINRIVPMMKAGDTENAIKLNSTEISPKRGEFIDAIDRLITAVDKRRDESIEAVQNRIATTIIVLIIVIIVSVLAGIAIAMFMGRKISLPIRAVQETSMRIAEGDLTVNKLAVHTKDEVGQLSEAMNQMVEKMKALIGNVAVSAESVTAAAQQISASTEEIASGSTSQANATQTMNELFKELSTAINAVARSAEQASELSNKTMGIAKDGGKVVHNSIEGMNQVNRQMSRLEEDSNKIGEIIEVIDDIADQTNLLALNAAIEAARAGDQGRGFAVVADEVRKLAERSSEATKQISAIIKGMQENTQQSVKAVGEGVVSSQKTGEAFENIIAMVNESAVKVSEIAAASEEQAAQSSEVLASIENISAATEEAAASSEETASTAQSLSQLAEELNNAVAIFKIR